MLCYIMIGLQRRLFVMKAEIGRITFQGTDYICVL